MFTQAAVADLEYWQKSGNKMIQQKITALLLDIKEHPFTGIGKPEALRFKLSGCWSRRVSQEHRIVYRLANESTVEVLSCRFHYT